MHDSEQEKELVREFLRRLLGEAKQPVGYRPDWLVSKDGSTSVFITFSKDESLFYDVGERDLKSWSSYKKAFVVFLLGTHESALVIPAKTLRAKVAKAGRPASEEYGDHKLHIVRGGVGFFFREVPSWSLVGYFNNYFPILSPVQE